MLLGLYGASGKIFQISNFFRKTLHCNNRDWKCFLWHFLPFWGGITLQIAFSPLILILITKIYPAVYQKKLEWQIENVVALSYGVSKMAQNEIFAILDSLSSMQKHVAIQKRENIVKTKGVLPGNKNN